MIYVPSSEPPQYTVTINSTCDPVLGRVLGWTMTFLCIPTDPGGSLGSSYTLTSACKIASPDNLADPFLTLISITYSPVFQAVFQGRMYEGNEGLCFCVAGTTPDTPGPLVTFTLTEP